MQNRRSSVEVLLVVGVPLLLAAVEVAHPQPQDLLALGVFRTTPGRANR